MKLEVPAPADIFGGFGVHEVLVCDQSLRGETLQKSIREVSWLQCKEALV